MKHYNLVNNLLGWLAFAVAAFTYCSTVEPTASFWDCPEFITTAYKLEVGHPPGAPFFMLTGNFFTQFTSDPTKVAMCVNIMSALLSAACILFLFWSVTHLTRKLLCHDGVVEKTWQAVLIMGAGLTGALAYTWSDTFWFSAVEGEVYAYSSMFTALVFWLILKWEDHADEPHSDRWLVLIFYLTGLSIGVHLLNLLCLPAITLVYYFKKHPQATAKGSICALLVSLLLVVAVLYGVVPGIVKVGGWFELFFVNVLGLGFNSGLIIYILVLIGVVLAAIWSTHGPNRRLITVLYTLSVGLLGIPFFLGHGTSATLIGCVLLAGLAWLLQRKDKVGEYVLRKQFLNTSLLCMLMLMIGYSSYAVIVIRSTQNTPMDQNSPEDIFTLGSYLGREQYGDKPLLYGQAFSSIPCFQRTTADESGQQAYTYMTEQGTRIQRHEKKTADEPDRYDEVSEQKGLIYPSEMKMLFPRIFSSAHTAAYQSWLGDITMHDVEAKWDTPFGEESNYGQMPSQGANLRFFLSYQVNFMYWRYFMWNFAGRQNDIQGHGNPDNGNWITGIPFIDNALYGNQSLLPKDLQDNKGYNAFYCLPLLLGLIGLFWQAFRGQKGVQQFWVVFFLFFMTGLAIVLYLNQTPQEPRERDYAYAGSFYAFAIWCGLGVLAILDLLKEHAKLSGTAVAAIVAVITLLVPIQMASQTWDDHDRSNRYTCRDFGQNYLMSLQEEGNPIIFTNGDNDTFPLWYNQEVEGVGTDARVCNLSYLQTDWYIDQMKRPAYNSPSVPITWPRLDFCSGTNEYVTIEPEAKQQILDFYKQDPETAKKQLGENPFELKNVLKYWVRSKNPDLHIIPTDTLYLTIDKEAVKQSGMMMAADSIPDKMVISLAGKNALYKNDLMMLEMLAQCNWKRPLYVALTVGEENYMNLGDNFVQEGLVNRITPFTTNKPGAKNFDTEKAYHNIMTRFKFGNLKQKGLYVDETTMRMCYTHRRLLAQTALALIAEHKDKKAIDILKKADVEIPYYNVPVDYMSGGLDMARGWLLTGQKAKGEEYLKKVWTNATQYLNYYLSLNADRFAQAQSDCIRQIMIMQSAAEVAGMVSPKLEAQYAKQLNALYTLYHGRGGRMPEGY